MHESHNHDLPSTEDSIKSTENSVKSSTEDYMNHTYFVIY